MSDLLNQPRAKFLAIAIVTLLAVAATVAAFIVSFPAHDANHVRAAIAVLAAIFVAGVFTHSRGRATQRKIENALRTRERSLEKAQRIAGFGIWTFDAVDNRMEWSDEMYRLLGLSPGTIEPSTSAFMTFIHPDDADSVPVIDRWNPDQSRAYSGEYRIIRIDGETWVIHSDIEVVVDSRGYLVSMDGVDQDITERRRAEAAVRESESRLRSLIDHSPSGISLKNKDGEYTLANRQYSNLRGVTGDNIIGKTLADLYPPEFAETVAAGDRAVMESGEPFTLDASLSVGGQTRALMMIKFPVRDAGGEISGLGTITTDITERKQAEELLRIREARWVMAHRMARLAHWERRIEDGVNRLSPEVAEIFGVPIEALTVTDEEYLGYLHADDRKRVRRAKAPRDKVSDGNTIEFRIVRPDGDIRTIFEVSEPLYDDSGQAIGEFGIIQDITDRRRIEQELSESEARYRQLFEDSPIGIWEYDFAGVKRVIDGLVRQGVEDFHEYFSDHRDVLLESVGAAQAVDANPAAVAIYSAAGKDELIKAAREPLRLASVDTYFLDLFARLAGGEQRIAIEHVIRTMDGKAVAVRTTLHVAPAHRDSWARIVTTDEDISERKHADDAVRESEQRLRAVIDNSPSAISMKDAFGRFVICNRKFEEIIGGRGKNIIGKIIFDLPDFDNAAEDVAAFDDEVAATGLPMDREEILEVGGVKRTFLTTKFPIRNNFGVVTALGGIYTDITERKRIDAERADLEARLAQSQRLEAIGTLAGGIAHDFNNILAAMTGYAHLALDAASDESPVQHDVEGIIKGIDRAAGLVQQILTFGRQGDTGRRPIDVGRTIPEVLDFIRVSVPSTISLTRDIDDHSSFIMANPTQLHQVLMNLCGNALDAIGDEPGAIKVAVKSIDAGDLADADQPRVQAERYVRLSVFDDGVGMDEATRKQAFDPFFTTKSVGKGTGLGLAVVHGIVGSNGGVIAIDSSPGQGTTVTIHFPCIEGPRDTETSESHQHLPHGRGRILLVDDEPGIVETQKRILGSLGYDVDAIECSMTALEMVRAAPDDYDLLITDQTMPRLTGDELALEVTKICPDMPVFLCSGRAVDPFGRTIELPGVRAVFAKPVDLAELTHGIHRLIGERFDRVSAAE